MTAPPQGYQPQYPAPPPPAARGPVSPRWTAGLFAAIVFLIAAGAAVWGTFEKIQSYRHTYAEGTAGSSREYRYAVTWWNVDQAGLSPSSPQDWFPPYGVLPAIGGGLLVFAAILALTAVSGRRAGLVTGARVSAAVGAGLLAGVAGIRLLDALQTLDQVNKETLVPGEGTEFEIGLGLYLPGGAAVLGIVGLLLMLNRGRAARVEPDTPRMGIPTPYNPQQYQPYQQAYGQQPGSQPFPAQAQQPASQPIPQVQQPTSQPFPAQAPQPTPHDQQPSQQPSSQPIPQAQPAPQAQQPEASAPQPAAPAPLPEAPKPSE